MRIQNVAFAIGLVAVSIQVFAHPSNPSTVETEAGGTTKFIDSDRNDLTLGNANAVISDREGGFYIAAQELNRVFHVSSSGAVTVVAGNGQASELGDGGPAAAASLYAPSALALDTTGNLVIGDRYELRFVDLSGNINVKYYSTVSPYALAFDSADNLYVATFYDAITGLSDAVISIAPNSGAVTIIEGTDSPCAGETDCVVNNPQMLPYGLAVVGTNLYIADEAHNRITLFDTEANTFINVAGTGVCGFSGDGGPALEAELCAPTGVSADAVGDLYFYDSKNARIRSINLKNGTIATIAGNGVAGFSGDGGSPLAASISSAAGTGITATSPKSFTFLDKVNNRIRSVNGGKVQTLVGDGNANFGGDGGPSTAALLLNPTYVTADSAGNLYVADSGNARVREINAQTGIISTVAGSTVGSSGDGGVAAKAQIVPGSMSFDAEGNLFVIDTNSATVRRVDAQSKIISTYASHMEEPAGLALDVAGNLYVSDALACVVWKFSQNGQQSIYAGKKGSCETLNGSTGKAIRFRSPQGLAIDSASNLYVADVLSNAVWSISLNGKARVVAGILGKFGYPASGSNVNSTGLGNPQGIYYQSGSLFITDTYFGRLYSVQLNTGLTEILAGGGFLDYSTPQPARTVLFSNPVSVFPDGRGGYLLTDAFNNSLAKIF